MSAASSSNMKANWKDVNYPTEAGRYLFRDGELWVEPRHIEVWNEFPNAVFAVTTAPALSGVRYVLRGYELPEEC
jgi:hypothetical protein